MRYQIIVAAAIFLAQSVALAAPRWVTLASKTIDGAGGPARLVLEHEGLSSKDGDSCVVVRVRDAEDAAKEYWTSCLWHEPFGYPRPVISGDIAAPKGSNYLVIAVGTSLSFDLDIRLFRAKLDRTDARQIVRNPKGDVKNSKELVEKFKDAFAENKAKFSLDDECGAYQAIVGIQSEGERIEVTSNSRNLSKKAPVCEARVVNYNLAAKGWTIAKQGGRRKRTQ